jgi:PadR family transcriptional regulator, regulatory protein PadR
MDIGPLEQQILLAVIALHPDGYGVSVQDHIEKRTKKAPSIGSIYAALERLEEKGFVKSREGEKTAERGGRRKLHFTVTATGQKTLRESLAAISSLQRGLRWNEGEAFA